MTTPVETTWLPVLPDGDVAWPLGGRLQRLPDQERAILGGITGLGTAVAPIAGVRVYGEPNHLRLLATIDRTGRFGDRLHVSLSYHHRDPLWDEIKAARMAFFPSDVDVVMILPAVQDYVNVHEHTFHLWQAPERWGMR